MNTLILGAGLVGSVMAMDLVADRGCKVTIVDASIENLARASRRAGGKVKTMRADLSDHAYLGKIVEPFDVVLGALPSRLGFAALRTMIEAKKPYCDISFMAEEALDLDAFARKRGVAAVVDCGVAPGLSNLLSGVAAMELKPCMRLDIMVGGLPVERRLPYEYKAGFSPSDVIEEYTRPARLVENGREVVKTALSEVEAVDLPGVGTLEAFNTDGLRSLIRTLKVPTMRERTMRYPGHADLMRAFRHTGLFDETPIAVKTADGGTAMVRPLDLTSRLLFPKWSYTEGEEDLTVMRIEAEGMLKKKSVLLRWDLLDRYDRKTGATSMGRTTAFPCTIVARLLAKGKIRQRGVLPPEKLVAEKGLVEHMMSELTKRGVTIRAERIELA
jgi:lysine 6-dehydrogenase